MDLRGSDGFEGVLAVVAAAAALAVVLAAASVAGGWIVLVEAEEAGLACLAPAFAGVSSSLDSSSSSDSSPHPISSSADAARERQKS